MVQIVMRWGTQIILIPITVYLVFFVFPHQHDQAYKLISALIAFSAVLSSLAYSAAGAAEKPESKDWYRYAGKCFFEATVLGGVTLVVNYLYTAELAGSPEDWPKAIDTSVNLLRSLAYGIGAGQLHIGLWLLQREFARSP
jgi:hypothetical protein